MMFPLKNTVTHCLHAHNLRWQAASLKRRYVLQHNAQVVRERHFKACAGLLGCVYALHWFSMTVQCLVFSFRFK